MNAFLACKKSEKFCRGLKFLETGFLIVQDVSPCTSLVYILCKLRKRCGKLDTCKSCVDAVHMGECHLRTNQRVKATANFERAIECIETTTADTFNRGEHW